MLVDPKEDGWERWLPANRPPGLLGSRWMISTKGVFLGLGFAIGALALLISPTVSRWAAVWAVGAWGVSGVALFTNPKE